ncbi:embryo-specific protein ATS3A-like [Oryza brachyantha]|uniref:embryo-specific protein ATS3A-like n=1 Tax=Oryza brachyantha TaxID=4533 RepID=UPI001AD9B25C|nr:embryo-specific protein ATS3A-like [Oryza brachyantha]
MARRRSGPPPPPHHRLALIALAALSSCLASATTLSSQPQPAEILLPSFATAAEAEADGGGAAEAARTCWYTVQIKTSCASPRRTSDAVSLAFGDAYRNEVYAASLAAGSPSSFERCATDTFRVGGPCGYGVCYLYLRRSGRDGWTPQWVRVYEPTSGTPSTFYYGDPLPNAVWYGLNRCPRLAVATSPAR